MKASTRLDKPSIRVFSNQEFADRIIGIFNGPSAGESNRRDVIKLATLNRTFFQASTDILWRKVPSLAPYLRLLPSCYDTEEPNYKVGPVLPVLAFMLTPGRTLGRDSAFTGQKRCPYLYVKVPNSYQLDGSFLCTIIQPGPRPSFPISGN